LLQQQLDYQVSVLEALGLIKYYDLPLFMFLTFPSLVAPPVIVLWLDVFLLLIQFVNSYIFLETLCLTLIELTVSLFVFLFCTVLTL
jgi:hypothetical protein